jgi:apolipoprotein N-acyltransferase
MHFNGQTKANLILFLLPALGALLLFIAWPPGGYAILAFVAFVPFLVLDQVVKGRPLAYFGAAFLGFFLFHLLAAWWMYSSTIIGSLLAHIFNAIYMAMVLFLFFLVKQKWNAQLSNLVVFPVFWLAMEFLHYHWALSWPWFTLGNVFSENTNWVQWYSLTGSLGGSFWVLVINGLLSSTFQYLLRHKRVQARTVFIIAAIFLAFPMLFSSHLKIDVHSGQKLKVLVVQPNINPQTEKFGGMNQQDQLDIAGQLVVKHNHREIDLIVLPETLITIPINEDSLEQSGWIRQLKAFAGGTRHTPVFTGAFTKRGTYIPASDQKAIVKNNGDEYVLYNSALLIDNERVQVYHKTKLVPLVEKQPFYNLMKPLRDFIEGSGGYFGRYGTHNETFAFELGSEKLAPLICFESAYGAYISNNAGQIAGFVVLITNDGWWSTRGGFRQHLAYARLRAIESRRYVVRSANTGVSAIIDPNGIIVDQLGYDKVGTLEANITVLYKPTFYSIYGDYVGLISLIISTIILLSIPTRLFFGKPLSRYKGINFHK